MKRITWLVSAAALALGLPASLSCTTIECGEGTHEEDGVCLPDEAAAPNENDCPSGTHLNPITLTCETDPGQYTECDEGTTEVEIIDGVRVCVGVGGATSCTSPPACPTPDGSKVAVCGFIYNVEDGTQMIAEGATGAACDPTNPTDDGPCALNIAFFDPLAFAADPTGTPPLATDAISIDDCGRFVGDNITRPFNGFMAVGLGNADGDTIVLFDEAPNPITQHVDLFHLTGIAFPVDPGDKRGTEHAMVVRKTTDAMWSTGDPIGTGQTFVEKGAYMPVFRHGDALVAGVTITVGGVTKPADDWYFADADTGENRTTVQDRASSGPNGAGLLINSGLTMHSGTGGEPEGCEWPSDLAASIPGVLFFSNREAHLEGDDTMTCP